MESKETSGGLCTFGDHESALEMLNLYSLEQLNRDLVDSCFINGSDRQKRELSEIDCSIQSNQVSNGNSRYSLGR